MSDQQTVDLIQDQANKWFHKFTDAISDEPFNHAHIYKLFVRGVVLNYHQKYECSIMEELFIDAYNIICNNATIFKKMCMPSKRIPNPFYRIYITGSLTLKRAFEPLATTANWNLDRLHKARHNNVLLDHQQILRSFKESSGMVAALNIPSIFEWVKTHLYNLTKSKVSVTPAQIEMALTTFRLSTEVGTLDLAKQYHFELVNEYLIDCIHSLVCLTACNLNQAHKLMDIVHVNIPEMGNDLMNNRYHLILGIGDRIHGNIQMDEAERLMCMLDNHKLYDSNNSIDDLEKIFDVCAVYLKHQVISNQAALPAFLCGHCVILSIALFETAMLKSKQIDKQLGYRHVIDVDYIISMIRCIAKIIPYSNPDIIKEISYLFHKTYPTLEIMIYQDFEFNINVTANATNTTFD